VISCRRKRGYPKEKQRDIIYSSHAEEGVSDRGKRRDPEEKAAKGTR